MKKISLIFFLIFGFLIPYSHGASAISKETLKTWMETDSVTILDVRQGRDWNSSEFKIKGAVRAVPNELASWKDQFSKDKKIVLYCA